MLSLIRCEKRTMLSMTLSSGELRSTYVSHGIMTNSTTVQILSEIRSTNREQNLKHRQCWQQPSPSSPCLGLSRIAQDSQSRPVRNLYYKNCLLNGIYLSSQTYVSIDKFTPTLVYTVIYLRVIMARCESVRWCVVVYGG